MSTTLLVDGNAVAYTIDVKECRGCQDFAKQYFNRLRDYAKQFPSLPKMILFFDDKRGGTWRDKIFPDYQKNRKAQRNNYTEKQKHELELRTKYLSYLEQQIRNSKFNYLSYPHTETDDLISLYCNNIQEDGETVIILTTDKDLFQLIRNTGKRKVHVLFLIKRKLIKDEKEGHEILEKKIMLGDPSDSIPSVCSGVGPKYYPDFKVFLEKMKETETDPTDIEKAKKVSESLGIKYIKSFSNFSAEQLRINKVLVNLNSVVKKDIKDYNVRTEYLRQNVNRAKLSPFSLYNIKLENELDPSINDGTYTNWTNVCYND